VLFATVLALAAAALHAAWNLLAKTSGERDLTAWGQYLIGGTLMLPVLLLTGAPSFDVAPQLAASALVNLLYVRFLVQAYHHGDFSMAYPLARGSGAALAAIGGALVYDDQLSALGWGGVAVIAFGLLTLVDRHTTSASLVAALTTGAMIATYTLIDTSGARDGDGFAYGVVLTFLSGVFMSVDGVARGRGRALRDHVQDEPWRVVVSGLCLTLAYSLVMVAVNHAPVGYVATLRESSLVFGAAAGWLLLDEQLGGRRLVSALVVAVGMGVLIVGGA
jgi:multidrug transporter EmrE-like cation transporter